SVSDGVVGGEGGIRTPDTVARMPHFECGAFNHSATSPDRRWANGADYLANEPLANKGAAYCEPAMPALVTMSPQRTISALTNFCISATGGVSSGMRLSLSICAVMSGSAITATSSLCSLSITGCGVFDGATIENQPATSKPGTPASLIGGTSGNALTRCLVE